MSEAPHVVIVGGGFGGLYAAKALAREPVRVTLLDRTNHHTFQPLLYQVATAGLNPGDIAVPIRRALRKAENVTVLMGEVTRVDPAARCVYLEDGDAVDLQIGKTWMTARRSLTIMSLSLPAPRTPTSATTSSPLSRLA